MAFEEFLQSIDRRTFLRIISFTGAAGLIYPRILISSLIPTELSRVVIVEDNTATNGTLINENTVQVMMDSGIKVLAQQDDIGEAWKTLLSNINSSNNIGIKVNCINSLLPTHPEVTYAVVNGLKQMVIDSTSFPENNIIIYDRRSYELTASGYTLNTSSTGVRYFGTDSSGVGYSNQSFDVYGVSQKLSRIITEMVDYIINISVLKSHGAVSGVTLCLKNHYGTCEHPGAMHSNYANPYIPALNALSPINTKQKVNICDALLGMVSGNPTGNPPQFAANKIIMSQDIVAVDYWGRKILEDNGCNTIYAAHHIDTAATDYGLGTNDPTQMDVVNIINPTTDIKSSNNNLNNHDNFLLQQNYPNPFNNHTQIRFYVSRPVEVKLSIFDSAGRCVVNGHINKTLKTGWHQVPWDGYNNSGKLVASGLYICQLKAGAFQKAIIMQLVK